MRRNTIILIFLLFSLNILIQSWINFYIFKEDDKNPPVITSLSRPEPQITTEIHPDHHALLIKINNKLDLYGQFFTNISDTNNGLNKTEFAKTEAEQLDVNALTNIKYNLINDMSNYDMTLPSFLSDPRLALLPESDKQEILEELARRLDSGEIEKRMFLPGYNYK